MRTIVFTGIMIFFTTLGWAEPRTWISKAGTELEAEFVSLKGDQLVLKAADGRKVSLSLKALSEGSQKQARVDHRAEEAIYVVVSDENRQGWSRGDANPVNFANLVSDYRFIAPEARILEKTANPVMPDDPFGDGPGDVFRKADFTEEMALQEIRDAGKKYENVFNYHKLKIWDYEESGKKLFESLRRRQAVCDEAGATLVILVPYPRSDTVPFTLDLEKDLAEIESLRKTAKRIQGAKVISSVSLIKQLPMLSALWGTSYVDSADSNLLQVAAFHSLVTGEAAELSRLHESRLSKMHIRSRPNFSAGGFPQWPSFDLKTLEAVAQAAHAEIQKRQ